MSSIDSDLEARPLGGRSAVGAIDLTRTGPGTPGGRFFRQFWLAIHRSEDLAPGQAKPIRILGEDFALYPGQSGNAQVIDYRCPHRGAQMHLGQVEGDDIRCIYHGWKFDCAGQCLEQPAEESGFARKVRMASFPTREFMGLIYAYFGAGPEPAFPPYPAGRTRAEERRGGTDGEARWETAPLDRVKPR